MKFTKLSTVILSAALVGLGSIPTAKAYAASEDECAIWICLPAGFPQGCGGAYGAFKHRLKKGKSPLPSFGSCAVKSPVNVPGFTESDPNDFTYIYKPMRHLKAYSYCKNHDEKGNCKEWKSVPERIRAGACHFTKDDTLADRERCTTISMIGVFEKNKQIGHKYYWGGGISPKVLNALGN